MDILYLLTICTPEILRNPNIIGTHFYMGINTSFIVTGQDSGVDT